MEQNKNLPGPDILKIKLGYQFEISKADFKKFGKIFMQFYETLENNGAKVSFIMID